MKVFFHGFPPKVISDKHTIVTFVKVSGMMSCMYFLFSICVMYHCHSMSLIITIF